MELRGWSGKHVNRCGRDGATRKGRRVSFPLPQFIPPINQIERGYKMQEFDLWDEEAELRSTHEALDVGKTYDAKISINDEELEFTGSATIMGLSYVMKRG